VARSIWTGAISFGLVSVPVALYSATEQHEVSFHQFEEGTGDRIRYKRVNERTDDEVDYADVVKAADVGGGEYVMVERDELDEIAPGRSRELAIETFVDFDEIDPIYFAKTYYLGPSGEESKRVYALLRDAMATANRVGIAKFVMRSKEYLAAIRADGPVLVLETMFFADEVRDPRAELDVPGKSSASSKEMKMATSLIDTMSGPWRAEDYRDTYTERVRELIEAKQAGEEVVPAAEPAEGTKVVDLMEALRSSVDAARGRRGEASDGAKKSSGKNPAAKKSAAKKAASKKATSNKASSKSSSKSDSKKASSKSGSKKAASKKSSSKGASKTTSSKKSGGSRSKRAS
jgi:DNA end-binding protein Ku